GAPAAGDVLGEREPDRPARRVRRGEALRRSADDDVPPPAGCRHVHRAHLQHLRTAHAAQRRSSVGQLHQPGARREAADGLRRRLPDAVALLRRRPHPRALPARDERGAPARQPRQPGPRGDDARARADRHQGDGLAERDRVRGTADRRPAGAAAGHHPRTAGARVAARDRPRGRPHALAEGARARAGRGLRVRRLGVAAAVAVTALAGLLAQPSHASRYLRIGIYDEAQTLYGPVDQTFPALKQLHVQEIRLNLYWGGNYGVARHRPAHPSDPADPAYDWSLYDRTVTYAARYGIHVLFSIYGTPGWANGGRGANVAPTRGLDLRNFALAAATRYSGSYVAADGTTLPAVKEWLAWNEPNNPVFLTPQFRRSGTRWIVQSAIDYAKICNAVF